MHPHYDMNGTLWGVTSVGITADGMSAGVFAPAGALLTFDRSGKAYVADPFTNAVDEYEGATLVRQINVRSNVAGAAVDPLENLYVGVNPNVEVGSNSAIYEYGPSGTGSITPVAMNLKASGAPATDGAGNVYAAYPGGIGVWKAGAFGSAAPARIIGFPPNQNSLSSFCVDTAGDVYAVGDTTIFYTAAGSNTSVPLPGNFGVSIVGNQVAAPIK